MARTAKGQLGQALNEAMLAIERANAHRENNFDGILTGKIDFNKQDELPRDKLVNLINHFGSQTFDRAHVSDDLFGNAYEYLIRNFASKAGKSSGEFYTPAEVGFLMDEVLQPQTGMSICDWASGSGGLLALSQEIEPELNFLSGFDAAKREMLAVVDMPDRKLNNLINILHKARGTLSKAKRELYTELTDEEMEKLVTIFRTSFGMGVDENGHPSI